MTLTDTKPASDTVAAPAAPAAPAPSASPAPSAPVATVTPAPRGIANLLSTGDSTQIGRLWVFFSLGFGVFSVVAAMLLAAERLSGGIDIFTGHRAHFLFFSLHRVSLVLLCVVPLFVGLAHCVVPRQIGAQAMAFPRLASASLASWLVGSGLLIASWGIDGGLAAGGDQEATELSLLSLAVIAVALAAASLNIACTVILQRSRSFPRLSDVPFFSFAMLVVGGLWLISFAVLLGNVMVMWVDARGATAAKYGLGENLYEQISWVFSQQQVFAFALPLLGVMGGALVSAVRSGAGAGAGSGAGASLDPAAASAPDPASPPVPVPEPATEPVPATRDRTHITAKVVLSLFAIVSFGGAMQGFYNPEFHSSPVYVVAPFLAGLILLALLRAYAKMATGSAGSKAATAAGSVVRPSVRSAARAGFPRPTLPLTLATMSFLLLLGAVALAATRTVGRLVGVLDVFSDDPGWRSDLDRLLSPFDNLAGTTAESSVFHAALLAGLLAGICGLYRWAPEVLGHRLRAAVGAPAGLLIFGGALLYAVPEMIAGFWGQPDVPAGSAAAAQAFMANSGVDAANVASFLGVLAVLVGVALVALDVLAALRQGVKAK